MKTLPVTESSQLRLPWYLPRADSPRLSNTSVSSEDQTMWSKRSTSQNFQSSSEKKWYQVSHEKMAGVHLGLNLENLEISKLVWCHE